MPSFDFVKDDCAIGSFLWVKRGYNLSSTQSIMLFQVKATEKKGSELTESAAMGFSMVCVMLQAVYTTAENEFRTIVIFDVSLRKRLRIRSVISVNYHYITVLCPFNLLIRFKCYNTV